MSSTLSMNSDCLSAAKSGQDNDYMGKWTAMNLASSEDAAKLSSTALRYFCTKGNNNSLSRSDLPCDITVQEAYSRAGRGVILLYSQYNYAINFMHCLSNNCTPCDYILASGTTFATKLVNF